MDCLDDTPATRREPLGEDELRRSSPPPLLTRRSALYLDFDGTLVDLAATPDAVRPLPNQTELLTALLDRLDGAVAVITGRRLESLDRWLEPARLAGAGLHGAQLRLAPDATASTTFPPAIGELARELIDDYRGDPRILIEDKGGAVALHFRQAPEREVDCSARLRRGAADRGLDVITGHFVIEARPRGIHKGVGLRRLHEVEPFQGRTPVFVGDDTTDEDAILAAQALGGFGIRVGAARSTALHRLPDVAAVHRWLWASADHLKDATR